MKPKNVIINNQKIISKNISIGKGLLDKMQNESKSQNYLKNDENLFNNKLNDKQNIKNPSLNCASFNKLLNTNFNTESSQKLRKILSKNNVSTNLIKSNFEKFISSPNDKVNNVRNFYLKPSTNNDDNDNILNINAETVNLSVTNNSNFPNSLNYSPLLNTKNSNSLSHLTNLNFNNNLLSNNQSINLSLNQKKGDFTFKNNILKVNQKSALKLNSIISESRKKLDLKEKDYPASSIYSNSVSSNSKKVANSKYKIDSKRLNSVFNKNQNNSNNNQFQSKKNILNLSVTNQIKLIDKYKDLGYNKDKTGNF